MYVRKGYPKLEINLEKLRNNIDWVQSKCRDQNIEIAGIIKGCSGIVECAQQYEEAGVKMIGSSRLEQLAAVKEHGIKTPLLMLRIPMLSEAKDVVEICDYSLNSEIEVINELARYAKEMQRRHSVILMVDLGDLREGFWNHEEIIETALAIETQMEYIDLAGIGVNVGCYGSIIATKEKLQELVDLAVKIEEKIGRELEIISGGATSSFMRILDGDMPERINMLRIGEAILLAYDLQYLYGYDLPELNTDVFTLKAEVIEVRDKPSHPIGEIGFDAFGHRMEYVDRGVRRRAIIGLGKVDYGDPDDLLPRMEGIEILGGSSDHTILDIQEAVNQGKDIKVGDILEFDLKYSTMVYLTSSTNVEKVFV